MIRRKSLFIAALVMALVLAAPAAQAAGILDSISNYAQSASSGWMNAALGYARSLFFGLAAIEFVWSAAQLTLRKSELSDLAVGLLMKVVTIALFGMVLTYAPDWIGRIQQSFTQAASGITGSPVSSLTPSGMFDKGVTLAGKMLGSGPSSLNPFKALLYAVVAGMSAIAIVIGYAIIALQLVIAQVEMYLVLGAGALLLGFLGSRWTLSFGERYFGYAMSIGVKLLTIYLIAAFGDTITNAVIAHLAVLAGSPKGLAPADMLGLGGSSLVFGAAGFMVPGIASSMLNGAPSMSMANAGQTARGIATAPITHGLGAASLVTRGGGLVAGGAALLASRFMGGKGGGIGGFPPGGGGGGSIIGSLGRAANGSVGSLAGGQGANRRGSSSSGSPRGAGLGGSGSSAAKGLSEAADARQGSAAANASPDSRNASQRQGEAAAAGQPGDGASQRPGFQSPRMMATAGGSQGDTVGARPTSDRLRKLSQALHHAADGMHNTSTRHVQHFGHDGGHASAQSIRLDI